MTTPDLVVVGHIAKDLQPSGFALGGTATFAALTALRQGVRVGVLTSCAPDLVIAGELAQAQWIRIPAPYTTTFENIYRPNGRTQLLRSRAAPIGAAAVPRAWRAAPMVLLAPIAQEVSPDLVPAFSGARLAATGQGWLRGWDEAGRVHYVPWHPPAGLLPAIGILVISEEDVAADAQAIRRYATEIPLLLVTQGERGATLYQHGEARQVPGFPAVEVDPTGAGDVFAVSFLLKLRETGDAYASAVYASCAASLAVQGRGTEAIPTPEEIATRLGVGNRSGQ